MGNIINNVPDVLHEFLVLKAKQLKVRQIDILITYLTTETFISEFQEFANYKKLEGNIFSILRGDERKERGQGEKATIKDKQSDE